MTHSKDAWWEYYPETNYAGGPAGAAYATTAPSGASELTPCNLPWNEVQTFPSVEYEQNALESAGQDISSKVVMTEDESIVPGKIVQHMQNGTWLDWALGINPAESGGGALPKSFLFHYDNGQNEYTAYGCYITEYKLEFKASMKRAKETISFNAYDVQDEDVAADDPPFDTTTAVANFKDLGSTSIVLDGVIYTDVKSLTLTVTNEYVTPENKGHGSYLHKYPYLLKRNVEIELEFADYDSDHLLDLQTETADPFTIVITPLGKANLSATNMKVKKDSLNIHEIPEKGQVIYKMTLEIGGTSVFTTP